MSARGADNGGDEMAVMSLGEHLEELRRRLIICLLTVGAAALVAWFFRERIMSVLIWPHVRAMEAFELDPTLKVSTYMEGVVAHLKACIIVALAVAAPVVIYHVWAFVAPGLFHHERRKVLRLGAACVVCFFAGVCFGYFLFVPIALRYLLTLSGPSTEPVLMISGYLTTFFFLTFAMGIAFQTPVIIFYLIRWKILRAESLRKARKGVILGAFVVGAFLTPPDPLTQIMMAVTLIMLYDLGVLLAAPNRETLGGFLRFTGSIVLIIGGVLAYLTFWPVGRVEAVRGGVSAGDTAVSPEKPVSVRRGDVVKTGSDGLARLTLGGGETILHLAADGRARVHGPGAFTLYEGEALLDNAGGGTVEVHAGPATVNADSARAELAVPGPDTVRITAMEGTVTARSEGTTRTVRAGHAVTLRTGGRPVDAEETARRWDEAIRGAPPED
ncbi:MAG: twin-arginine translocase subunit TatC [Candidatus Brocadiia bacterium]